MRTCIKLQGVDNDRVAPARAVAWKQIATRLPLAIVFVPAVGTLVCQALEVTPPPPPANEALTSKVMTSATAVARAGGPAAASGVEMPTLKVVPAFAKVTVPVRHEIAEEPVVSIVCDAPSDVCTRPIHINASFAASMTVPVVAREEPRPGLGPM